MAIWRCWAIGCGTGGGPGDFGGLIQVDTLARKFEMILDLRLKAFSGCNWGNRMGSR